MTAVFCWMGVTFLTDEIEDKGNVFLDPDK